MKPTTAIIGSVLLAGCISAASASTRPPGAESLQATVASLNAAVFDAFNQCSDPDQLARHARYFDERVEFYHDNGGVTWSRDEMLERTRLNACGKYRRELVAGTLEVFPIQGFGAIAQGTHRFCDSASGSCEGLADFVIIWRELEGTWQITRVLSYGHRASSP